MVFESQCLNNQVSGPSGCFAHVKPETTFGASQDQARPSRPGLVPHVMDIFCSTGARVGSRESSVALRLSKFQLYSVSAYGRSELQGFKIDSGLKAKAYMPRMSPAVRATRSDGHFQEKLTAADF